MVGIIANISSARNLRQSGLIPEFNTIRDECYAQAEELYQQYKK